MFTYLCEGSNVMRSIHGVGELMTQVVLRGGGFLPMTPLAAAPEGNVKQTEPEKEDILVMDTKLKIIEILQVLASQTNGHHLLSLSASTVPCDRLIYSCLVCTSFQVLQGQLWSTHCTDDDIMQWLKPCSRLESTADSCVFNSGLWMADVLKWRALTACTVLVTLDLQDHLKPPKEGSYACFWIDVSLNSWCLHVCQSLAVLSIFGFSLLFIP